MPAVIQKPHGFFGPALLLVGLVALLIIGDLVIEARPLQVFYINIIAALIGGNLCVIVSRWQSR